MNKYKYLIQNTLLFAFSSVIVKILSFFMLPLYTGVLTASEYGIAEFFATTITLLTPIVTLSIAEAVIRFLLSKETDRTAVFTIGFLIVVAGSLILYLLKPLFNIFNEAFELYFNYFILMYFTSSLETMLFRFAKGMEKVKECSINAIVVVVVTIISNLLLLLGFKMRLEGYLLSTIFAHCASVIYLSCVCKAWRYFKFSSINKKYIVEMLAYSIPFIPTAIAWWINAAFDRYMLVYMIGTAANGLFSAASKLPSTINIVTSMFCQAWQISGVKEYGSEEYEDFYTNVYKIYDTIMVFGIAILIPVTPLLAKFLLSGDFYQAWIYSPVLYMSALFSGLTGMLSSVFYAVKKTKVLMQSTVAGSVVNVILNYILIKNIGIQGAGIATMISFFVTWLIRLCSTRKYIHIRLNIAKTMFVYFILALQIVVMLSNLEYRFLISAVIAVVVYAVNIPDCLKFAGFVINIINKKKERKNDVD